MRSYTAPESYLINAPFISDARSQYTLVGCIESVVCVLDTTPDLLTDCSNETLCVEIDLRATNACTTAVSPLSWGPNGAGGSLNLSGSSEIPGNTQGGNFGGSIPANSTIDITDDDTDFDINRTPGQGFSLEFLFSAGGESATIRCEFDGSAGNGSTAEAERVS